jgi:hypothetical protein
MELNEEDWAKMMFGQRILMEEQRLVTFGFGWNGQRRRQYCEGKSK